MSSIMRARSGLMGRGEPSEVMGALPSWRLLDLRCSGSDAPTVTRYSASPPRNCADRDACSPPASGFVHRRNLVVAARCGEGRLIIRLADLRHRAFAKTVFGEAMRSRPGNPPERKLDGGEGKEGGGGLRIADRRSRPAGLVGHAEAGTNGRGVPPICQIAHRRCQPRAGRHPRRKSALPFVLGQLARAAHARPAARAHHRSDPRGEGADYSFEAANVQHEHEWRVWQTAKLPPGKMLMPGVVSHATKLVEHPQLVADRILL